MKKRYSYLISYVYNNGSGAAMLSRIKKIRTMEDITDLRKQIEDRSGIDSIAITNYQLIGREV